jgi:hypothetical protein
LRGGGCGRGGFAAGDADDAKDGEFGERGARDEDAVGGRVEVGRSDLHAVVEEREQIVGDDAFEGVAVSIAEADPDAVELRSAEEDFALGLEVVGEVANEINGSNFGEGDGLVLAIGRQEVDGICLAEARRIEIAAQGLLVGEHDDHFLVGRGWGAIFQELRIPGVEWLQKSGNLPIRKMYVMLSKFCCQVGDSIGVRPRSAAR